MGATSPTDTSALTTGDTLAGLTAATEYFIVVRVVDSEGNEDANVVEVSATCRENGAD